MENQLNITEIFQSIDNADATKFASFLSSEGCFRYANHPAIIGRDAIEAFVAGFFKSIKGIRHSKLESWSTPEAIFVNGSVKYTRHNDTTLEIPFACTWKLKDHLIDQYLIFIDSSELYQ